MNLNKSYDYFQPEKITDRVHIVGCGSVGSTVAENLARCGITKFTLWDMDKVESHNIANQMFRDAHIGALKVDALYDLLVEINEQCSSTVKIKPSGWQGENLAGYVFLCVDSIELRREIVENIKDNPNVKAVFDFRTLLESAQHFAADWGIYNDRENLLKTMQFSHEEAAESTPVSACGMTLGVATTVRIISALGVNNFMNFVKGKGLKKLVLADGFNMNIDAF